MKISYNHLTTQERATAMIMRDDHCSIRSIAKRLGRSASTISREFKRGESDGAYNANRAHQAAVERLAAPRQKSKLRSGTALLIVVQTFLNQLWSPEQIAGKLKLLWPGDPTKTVSHETIYSAIYALPRGEARREMVACLRHHRQVRRPRSRGTDRRGQIPNMQNISTRPSAVEGREIPGHWEGDLIKGASNRSSVGTLVERSSRLVVLVKLNNATTIEVVTGFATVLKRIPTALRLSMTYDQGREMHNHKTLTEKTGIDVYFADPHSPWQRGSNENANGLLRQYLPKGSDLSGYSQKELDAIAYSLNTRPKKILGWKTPLEVYSEYVILSKLKINSPSQPQCCA